MRLPFEAHLAGLTETGYALLLAQARACRGLPPVPAVPRQPGEDRTRSETRPSPGPAS